MARDDRAGHALGGRGEVDLGAQQQQHLAAFQRHAFRHGQDQPVAARGGDEGDRNVSQDHADIPKADAHKGPEEFRKRVIKGLGQPSGGRLKDAVKRYAEGLLR